MDNRKQSRESGRVLVLMVILMLTLSALWIIALTMTGSELSFVGGRKTVSQRFYDAEAGATEVLENFEANIPTTPANAPVTSVTVTDEAGNNVANVTIRPVRNDATYAQTFNLPQQEHEFAPPEGSGSGVNTAEARRYAITSEAGGRIVQTGVYRVVPK
jgi:hypothetical protein